MFQLTVPHPDPSPSGAFYLVTEEGEQGPYETYDAAADAAERPMSNLQGFDPRRGYYIIDRSEPGEA